jgi:hypothetical protein
LANRLKKEPTSQNTPPTVAMITAADTIVSAAAMVARWRSLSSRFIG